VNHQWEDKTVRAFYVFLILFGLIAPPLLSHAQIILDADFFNRDIQVFYLSDFDFTGRGRSPLIFWIRIKNDNTARDLKISLEIRSQRFGSLARGVSRPFHMAPGQVLRMDNRDLVRGRSPFELQDYRLESPGEMLREGILATGRLPSDTYFFKLEVWDIRDPSVRTSKELSLQVSNPTRIELISPGVQAGEATLPEIYTTLPQFVWESNASEFILTVCEKLPTNSSPEDVMNNEPRFRRRVRSTAVVYPTTGAWPLEEGKEYYWQVKAIMYTSRGPIELESEIWGFRIGQISQGNLTQLQIQIINLLRQILPTDVFQALVGDRGERFRPTGMVLNDGTPMSLEELVRLLHRFQQGELEAQNYQIE